jgi:predicted house-cleaning noncanonical NTP pyrophosphatase (MazG superfamily)
LYNKRFNHYNKKDILKASYTFEILEHLSKPTKETLPKVTLKADKIAALNNKAKEELLEKKRKKTKEENNS